MLCTRNYCLRDESLRAELVWKLRRLAVYVEQDAIGQLRGSIQKEHPLFTEILVLVRSYCYPETHDTAECGHTVPSKAQTG